MGSKLEKGLEGKKMKDLEHKSQSLDTKSVSHKPIFLIFFFLFFFFFLLVCTGPKSPYHVEEAKKRKRKKTLIGHRSPASLTGIGSDMCRTPVLRQKWRVGAT